MHGLRTAKAATRSLFALALALVLALRLLVPTGFMPTFENGTVTIAVCPDGPIPLFAPHSHQHGKTAKLHQPCPYAAASSPGSVAADGVALATPARPAIPLSLQRAPATPLDDRKHERPPSIGPPLKA